MDPYMMPSLQNAIAELDYTAAAPPMPRSPIVAGVLSSGSPTSTTLHGVPFSPSHQDFEIERNGRAGVKSPYSRNRILTPSRAAMPVPLTDYSNDLAFQTSVGQLIAAKDRAFSVSGHIPLDPEFLTLFFRSQSGITHSLDFPIDVEISTPPPLDVLIAACKPHATCELDGFSDRESLFYPTQLPLTATLELANHPILDAIRTALFPTLSTGQYLVAQRDKLEIIPAGGHMCPQRRTINNEGKVATLIVTLPVRFRGGALVIHDFDGNREKFYGRGGKSADMEWTAFLAECDHEVETVQKGCRMTMSYNIYLKTVGPTAEPADLLVVPSDRFLDTVSPILNICRGQWIAFYLTEDYNASPSDTLAESLAPELKGGDALLFQTLKLYNLSPELRWTAGGYIWPVDRPVDLGLEKIPPKISRASQSGSPRRSSRRSDRFSAVRTSFSISPHSDSEEEEVESLRSRVEDSGAIPIADADIFIVADKEFMGGTSKMTKARVPYVSGGVLDKLIVNVLLLVFVP